MGFFEKFRGKEGPKKTEGLKPNPFSGPEAAYQPSSQEMGKKVEHDPSGMFDGFQAVTETQQQGSFQIPNPEKNTENPFFWKGVVQQLEKDLSYATNPTQAEVAISLAREMVSLTELKEKGNLPQALDTNRVGDFITQGFGRGEEQAA